MSDNSTRRGFFRKMGLGLFSAATGDKLAAGLDLLNQPGDPLLFVGTYTNAGGLGIYRCRFDDTSGRITVEGVEKGVLNPSFLAIDRSRKRLFAVNETGETDGQPGGAVSAFTLDPESGVLRFVNRRSSRGADPAHLTIDRTGRFVLVANYSSGTVAVLPVADDGSLGEATDVVQHHGSSVNPKRQREPHAHSVTLDGPNQFAYTADLGIDKIMIYRFDSKQGTLAPASSPWAALKPGAGPRHLAFHPGGQEVYVADELDSTLTRFSVDRSTGALDERQVIRTVPEEFSGDNFPAEVRVGPLGNFVYVSNRGHNSIAVFAVSGKTGALAPVQHQPVQGNWPRHFVLDAAGRYLLVANQRSNTITVFALDPEKGTLIPTNRHLDIPSPVCLTWL